MNIFSTVQVAAVRITIQLHNFGIQNLPYTHKAQSVLGGTTFFPENMQEKIHKMPEFYLILDCQKN